MERLNLARKNGEILKKPLQIEPKQTQEILDATCAFIKQHLNHQLQQTQVIPPAAKVIRDLWDDQFGEEIPKQRQPFEKVLSQLQWILGDQTLHLDSPRFFAYVPAPNNLMGIVAQCISGAVNPFCGSWFEGAGPALIEQKTIQWMLSVFGFSQEASGLFVSGGSMGNLLGLILAKKNAKKNRPSNELLDMGKIYWSDQTHMSVPKAANIIGFEDHQINVISSDEQGSLVIANLVTEIERDLKNGHYPLCVVGNLGTTNTGAVDDFSELTSLSRKYGFWLHADGAYGAAAAFCERGKKLLTDIGSVDSLCFDPHKWLFQPYECSVFFCREQTNLYSLFKTQAGYLPEFNRDRADINYCDYGLQLTRDFKALKVWLTLQFWGSDEIASAVDMAFKNSEMFEQLVSESKDFEVCTPAQLGVVTFSYSAPAKNRMIVEEIQRAGSFMVSTTHYKDQEVIRVCMIHPEIDRPLLEEFIIELIRAKDLVAGNS